MKIIFSRKGFDSSAGQVPSPILPSGKLHSLPIPEPANGRRVKRYADIMIDGQSLGRLVADLTKGAIQPHDQAHLDPDLYASSLERHPGWKPLFGQVSAAERHLQRHQVGAGDVFLFFGWFRAVELIAGAYRYVKGAPDLHVLFGWLQIEQRIAVAQAADLPTWACDHPHYHGTRSQKLDSIYISMDRLVLPRCTVQLPGAGVFEDFHPALCLTDGGRSRSFWKLPPWFYPEGRPSHLSYHASQGRWTHNHDYVLLHTVGRGQEFVLDCAAYPEAIDWLGSLLTQHAGRANHQPEHQGFPH